jgi:hypothetical protein
MEKERKIFKYIRIFGNSMLLLSLWRFGSHYESNINNIFMTYFTLYIALIVLMIIGTEKRFVSTDYTKVVKVRLLGDSHMVACYGSAISFIINSNKYPYHKLLLFSISCLVFTLIFYFLFKLLRNILLKNFG